MKFGECRVAQVRQRGLMQVVQVAASQRARITLSAGPLLQYVHCHAYFEGAICVVLFGMWSHLISTGVGLMLRNPIGFRTPSKLERLPRDVRAILIRVEMGEMPLVSHLSEQEWHKCSFQLQWTPVSPTGRVPSLGLQRAGRRSKWKPVVVAGRFPCLAPQAT